VPLVSNAGVAAHVLYERAHEPSDDSPILYRERAYSVDGETTDAELEAHLEAELSSIQASWRDRDAPQFVQLASFDHEFEDEPSYPPIATLSWKDWQGRTEVWIRGVRRSTTPPNNAGLGEDEPKASELSELIPHQDDEEDEDFGTDPLLLVGERKSHQTSESDGSERNASPDSGTSWAAPSRSGEYRVPDESGAEDSAVPPPSSQRVLCGEELLGTLFERMHELLYLEQVPKGAEYVIATLEELIPCDGVLVHVFDEKAGEFVVVRALGARQGDVLLIRTSGTDSHLADAMRRQTTLELSREEAMASPVLWEALGLDVEFALCGPVHQDTRCFGAIEIARRPGLSPFSEAQIQALEYVCEQFADFVANRLLSFEAEAILPR
jgi:hypothetical protein